jgi:hypothetical protein
VIQVQFIFDRSIIRDIKSKYIPQRLRINIEVHDVWIELYLIENSFFLKFTTNNKDIQFIQVTNEVAEALLQSNEEIFYREAEKYLTEATKEIQKELWR